MFVRDFFNNSSTVSALVPATIATMPFAFGLYWLECIEFTIGRRVSSIDKRLPIFSGKISHSLRVFFDPRF
jgi:hypothetical protein